MNRNSFIIFFLFTLIISCQNKVDNTTKVESDEDSDFKYTNTLIKETSPYLLQHAHNPVNWYPWGEQALKIAKTQNKPLLISIGYSACHWCHVMENESFEDSTVAHFMNENFICIKVDREERPDIDNIYMTAVQLMQQGGGWPLNCFALPDGKPFYGGTYYPKNKWLELLKSIKIEYQENPQKIIDYANKLTQGIIDNDIIVKSNDDSPFNMNNIHQSVNELKPNLDFKNGGTKQIPKFPLPNNYEFLLEYYFHSKDKEILDFLNLSLTKMAYGGIYDQIGGGFSRYSTDLYWKVPHFEKMLYDNAQLVSLYSKAYLLTKNPEFKRVVQHSLKFIETELTAPNGSFYSSIDADSEGEEGKFYVWNKDHLKATLKEDYNVSKELYSLDKNGEWEGNQILLRTKNNSDLALKLNISIEELITKQNSINTTLLKEREKRIKPKIDDKVLTSWNSLMLKGYIDAYKAFNYKDYLISALKSASFIEKNQIKKDGGINHNYKNGVSNIDGFLDDYSFTIEAYIALYEITLDEKWLNLSNKLAKYVLTNFYNKENSLFFYTSSQSKEVIVRKIEIYDNVVPSSNSSMAKSLFLLGKYYDNKQYSEIAIQMLKNIEKNFSSYILNYSNWAILLLNNANPFYEIAVTGKEAKAKIAKIQQEFIPNKMIIGSEIESNLPLLQDKFINEITMIYVCNNKTCKLPVENVDEAIEQLK